MALNVPAQTENDLLEFEGVTEGEDWMKCESRIGKGGYSTVYKVPRYRSLADV